MLSKLTYTIPLLLRDQKPPTIHQKLGILMMSELLLKVQHLYHIRSVRWHVIWHYYSSGDLKKFILAIIYPGEPEMQQIQSAAFPWYEIVRGNNILLERYTYETFCFWYRIWSRTNISSCIRNRLILWTAYCMHYYIRFINYKSAEVKL